MGVSLALLRSGAGVAMRDSMRDSYDVDCEGCDGFDNEAFEEASWSYVEKRNSPVVARVSGR